MDAGLYQIGEGRAGGLQGGLGQAFHSCVGYHGRALAICATVVGPYSATCPSPPLPFPSLRTLAAGIYCLQRLYPGLAEDTLPLSCVSAT